VKTIGDSALSSGIEKTCGHQKKGNVLKIGCKKENGGGRANRTIKSPVRTGGRLVFVNVEPNQRRFLANTEGKVTNYGSGGGNATGTVGEENTSQGIIKSFEAS